MLTTPSSRIYYLDSTTFIRNHLLTETSTEWVHKSYVITSPDSGSQSNVFINSEGHALLGDFGLTAISNLSSMNTTINNAGALRWLSPEVCDAIVDISRTLLRIAYFSSYYNPILVQRQHKETYLRSGESVFR